MSHLTMLRGMQLAMQVYNVYICTYCTHKFNWCIADKYYYKWFGIRLHTL